MGSRMQNKVQHHKMSECDINYFAGILHLFPSIPYCHLHVVIPVEPPGVNDLGDNLDIWGNPDASQEDTGTVQVSNQSPFPPPYAKSASSSGEIQIHIDIARKLFETCPISTQLRLSIA